MGNIVSFTKIYINFSGGNFQLKRVESADETEDSTTKVVTAIGVRGGAGNQDSEGGGSMKLQVFREDVPEVNYRKLKARKEFFSLTFQDDDGGERWQYQGCRVATVERSDNADGKLMNSVMLTWQQRRQLPSQPVA